MKHSFLFAIISLAALSLTACGSGSSSTPQTEIDSLSYAIGVARTDGLDAYLRQQGVEEDQLVTFLRGFRAGARQTAPDEIAYNVGVQVGQMVSKNWVKSLNAQIFGEEDSVSTINRELLLAGFVDAVSGDSTGFLPNIPVARTFVEKHMNDLRERMMAEKYAAYKDSCERYLVENRQKEGVVETESGLQYRIIKEGKGAVPTKSDKVKVVYTGQLIDGTEFDRSKDDQPTTFRITQVVKGWQEALQMMPVGSRWELVIPSDLGYGSKENRGAIRPFSTLIFDVELIEIEPKADKKAKKAAKK